VLHARNVFHAVAEKLDESVVRQFDLLGFSIGDNQPAARKTPRSGVGWWQIALFK
jgi:hypothetical protein